VVHGLGHERIALRPVVAPAVDQPNAYRVAPGHEPEAVVLDLVNPVGPGRGLVGWGRQARLYEGFSQLLRLIIDPTQAPVWLISHISPKYLKALIN
jgi:hypothetical protein